MGYRVRSARSSQDAETKRIIRQVKKAIDAGQDWREAIKAIESIEDSVQRRKASKSIIEYV